MSTPSSASASASATVVAPGARICFNSHCKEVTQDHSALRKKGWRLRNGETAELCDRCSCAFEQGTFCQKFHSDVAGWRNCETCGKRVHCGCIASASTYVFADAGGIECYACARNSLSMAPNQMLSSPMLVHQHALERKDMPSKTWRQAGPFSGQWRQASHIWNLSNVQSDLQQRLSYEFDRPLHIEKMTPGGRQSTSAREKKIEELPERLMCTSLNNTAQDKYAHSNTGENDSTRKLVVSGPCSTSLGINFETKPNSSINLQPLPVSKDDASLLPGLASSFSSSNGVKESMKLSSNQPIRQGTSPLPKKYYPQGMTDEELQNLSNGRARVDTHSRAQLLPRYWPRITDQELQQISGNSNSSITPLFEKMLSASDAGRIGRLVLPKKCAEAYFPIISQPEGLPLRVQDATGKDWVFQFRFWPNNNSRMYVLEGVTPCIQAMKLQAGDTVTFSRIDPEGKLVMGFRKASNSSFEQDPQTQKSGNNFSLAPECNDQNATGPILYASLRSSNCSIDSRDPVNATEQSNLPMSTKAGLTHNDGQQARSLQISTKRKASSLGSKSKRLRIENEEAMELKLTWEEAQELLRPPPNSSPSVVVIEGHEFEEYEEAPVLGKRTYITTNQAGSSCSAAQELSLEPTSDMLSCKTGASKSAKTKAETDNKIEAEGGGLNALANLAILGEGKIPPASRPTTKHPRHRPGCTCIVCIQPPSGKGPKHKQSCACNVCLTVKRRFTTLMLRREKRQSEKEAEVSKNQRSEALPQAVIDPPSSSPSDVSASQKVTTNADTAVDDPRRTSPSPLKTPKIDLNIQPEREEEPSPKPDTGSVTRLLQEATTGTVS